VEVGQASCRPATPRTLEDAGWQQLRDIRAVILKEQKCAPASVSH